MIVNTGNGIGGYRGDPQKLPASTRPIAALPPLAPEQFGDKDFCKAYGTRYAYMTGAMANAIASAELVIAIGKAGMLGSYGAGGVLPERVEADVVRIKKALGSRPFAVNLIHSPHKAMMEQRCIEILLKHNVDVIEASAFMGLTEPLLDYRLAGIYRHTNGQVRSRNRVIAKISRSEVAQRFMSPAPQEIVKSLLAKGKISPEQAQLADYLPVADDITVEADSGGHTDRRALTVLLPLIIELRNRLQQQFAHPQPLRVGAAGRFP